MKIIFRSRDGRREVACGTGERLLYAGLRAGLALPHECASGTCGTCRARARPGTVTDLWPLAPGRADLDPAKGEILLCQHRGVRDCEILVPGPAPPAVAGAAIPAHRGAVVSSIRRLADDVAAFQLTLDAPIDYLAGQFLVIEASGLAGYRAYSMVNYRRRSRSLEFVIKALPGGGFSSRLFGEEAPGMRVETFGPLGRATFDPLEEANLLCIAGGSGIAGMMAILAHANSSRHFRDKRGDLFFGVRTLADAFFLDELSNEVRRASGGLRVIVATSEEPVPASAAARYPDLAFASGFVHGVAGQQMAGCYDAVIAYVAGPPPMVDATLHTLIKDARLPAHRIRYDKFT